MHTALAYLRYLLKARGSHALHAPFLYQFYSDLIAASKKYYAFGAMDTLRLSLMQDTTLIQMQDYGAGSKHLKSQRSIGQIARKSAVTKKEGELLFKVVNELMPNTIVELGTSIGISTLYMAQARKKAHIHTFEGCPETAQVAARNFKYMQADNITLHVGNIDDTLPTKIKKIGKIDLAYIDANHTYEATIRYFSHILPAMSTEGVLIFDDIHWSKGMEQAWEEIIQRPEVTISVDLFSFGIVFLSQKFSKEHFVLRF